MEVGTQVFYHPAYAWGKTQPPSWMCEIVALVDHVEWISHEKPSEPIKLATIKGKRPDGSMFVCENIQVFENHEARRHLLKPDGETDDDLLRAGWVGLV